MTKSPRARFLEDKNRVDRHLALVASPELQATIEAVKLHYIQTLPDTTHPQASWNKACKIEGAIEALDLLMNFGDVSEPPKRPDRHPTMNPV